VLLDLTHGLASEGSVAVHHFVEQDSEGPGVHPEVVGVAEEHFGGHILIGATEGGSGGVDVFGSPSEIAQFDVEVPVEQ